MTWGILTRKVSPDGSEQPRRRVGGPAGTARPRRLPTEGFFLGTDNFGLDMWSRLLHGARVSLSVAVATVLIGTTLATLLGAFTGYAGGKIDIVIGRFVDAFMSLPQLVVLLTIMAVLGPGLVNVIIALSARAAITESRIVRSAIVSVKQLQYIDAARALGASPARILFLHALPNVMAPIIIIATTALGSAILAEASLSFLGAGVPPAAPTWGGMLSSEGRRFMIVAPWMAIFPGLALSLAVFGINVLGDGLRDVFDPRLRGGSGRFK
ncbi:MAG: ABC transporter permease [Chloroflexi bacterium]|nr:ABC transporter permease [Chloroflexota bacterium]